MDLTKDRFLHRLDFARKMPPLDKEDVLKWLLENDNTRLFLMMVLASDPNPVIAKNKKTGKWQGVEVKENDG